MANEQSKRVMISSGSPDMAYINNTEIVYGRFFNEREYEEGSAVGIIDSTSASQLYGYEDVVGQTMQVGQGSIRKKITIIGVEKGITSPGHEESAGYAKGTFYLDRQSADQSCENKYHNYYV